MTNQFPFPGGQQGRPFGNQNFPGSMMPPFGQSPRQFPGQFPGQFPSQFPGQFPGGQQQGPLFPPSSPRPGQQQGSAPTSPPPSFTPQRHQQQQGVGVFAVDPGAIRGCLFRNTFIWLENGRSFWFYPTFVGRRSVSGFRWNGFMWTYYGTDLDRIASFQCF